MKSIDDKPRYFGITYYRYDSKYKNVNEVLEDEMEFIWFEIPEEQYALTTKEDVLGYDSEVIWSEYGAESPDEAFQLFWQALETEDEALAKRISGAYYVAYVLSGRECLSEPSIGAYLEVESASDFWGRKDYSLLKEGYNISEEGGMSASWLEYNENSVNSRFGTNASIMAGYQYLYYDLDGAPDEAINLYQIDGRWFYHAVIPICLWGGYLAWEIDIRIASVFMLWILE